MLGKNDWAWWGGLDHRDPAVDRLIARYLEGRDVLSVDGELTYIPIEEKLSVYYSMEADESKPLTEESRAYLLAVYDDDLHRMPAEVDIDVSEFD